MKNEKRTLRVRIRNLVACLVLSAPCLGCNPGNAPPVFTGASVVPSMIPGFRPFFPPLTNPLMGGRVATMVPPPLIWRFPPPGGRPTMPPGPWGGLSGDPTGTGFDPTYGPWSDPGNRVPGAVGYTPAGSDPTYDPWSDPGNRVPGAVGYTPAGSDPTYDPWSDPGNRVPGAGSNL